MEELLALLNNPIVLALAGIVVKFVPGVREKIANDVIPFINTILAWLALTLSGPGLATAMGGPLAVDPGTVQTAGFLGLTGALASLGSAVWQATQAWVIHELFGRALLPERPKDSKRFLRTRPRKKD